MSVFSKSNVSSGLVERCSECPTSRNSRRYWSWDDGKCHLKVHWNDDVWEVSFVDTKNDMVNWINENTTDTFVLFFDCEWSRSTRKGIGLIQIATDVSKCKVIIVDCTKVSLEQIRKKFFNAFTMVGWSSSNDVKRLEQDETKRQNLLKKVIDLQKLISNQEMFDKLGQEEKEKVANYVPLDKNGKVQENKRIINGQISHNVWSLDNMAECFLGHTAKVPLEKHPQWSNGKWKFKDRDIHYAANDVIGLAYIYDKLKYIYKLKF